MKKIMKVMNEDTKNNPNTTDKDPLKVDKIKIYYNIWYIIVSRV